MAKKKDFQKEMSKMMSQMKGYLARFGKETRIFAKKGEKEIIKASRIGRRHFDIIALNLQKEKIYRDIGKKIASSPNIQKEAVEAYLKKLKKLESAIRSKKREIAAVTKSGGKE